MISKQPIGSHQNRLHRAPMLHLCALTLGASLLLAGGPVSAAAQLTVPVTRDASDPGAPSSSESAEPLAKNGYVLGPSDEVLIHAIDAPEISDKNQRIDADGDLRLARVGRLRAAGLTVAQLEQELRKRLGVYLQEPDVTVTVATVRSQNVSVTGAVSEPGMKVLDGRKTLTDVLSAAGGLTPDAGPIVRVVRNPAQGRIDIPGAVTDAHGFTVVEIDARALLEGRVPDKNVLIRPNDVVAVPRAELIYVIGEVARPGPLQVTSKQATTVMEAVSASGGVMRTAASGKARILRRVPGQDARTEIPVDLKQMMQGKANDFPMTVGDILVVPDSSGKRFTTRAVEAAIQVGMMIGTYGLVR